MPNALEQALARANRTDERIGLFGKSHQQQIAERVVVDVGEAMGERASICSRSRKRPVDPPSSAMATTESICAPMSRRAAMRRGWPVPPPMETALRR